MVAIMMIGFVMVWRCVYEGNGYHGNCVDADDADDEHGAIGVDDDEGGDDCGGDDDGDENDAGDDTEYDDHGDHDNDNGGR